MDGWHLKCSIPCCWTKQFSLAQKQKEIAASASALIDGKSREL